jgi:pSer/pThr/pTyr-binding forkhead associated (FHA) protein
MAKLLIHESTGVREFELVDDEIQIGRELDNKLRISDPSVSRHHAEIRRTRQGYVILDKKSSNGIIINDEKVVEAVLADGDQVTLGQIRIEFLNPDGKGIPPSKPAIDPAQTAQIPISVLAESQSLAKDSSEPITDLPSPDSSYQNPVCEPLEPGAADSSKRPSDRSTAAQGENEMSQQDNAATPNMISKPGANPILALLLTWFVLGIGHIVVNGQTRKWLFILIANIIGNIICCLPGIFIWVLSIIDSYQTAIRLKSGESIPENEYSMPLLYKIVKILDKTATCSRA